MQDKLPHFVLYGEIDGAEPPLEYVVPLNDSTIDDNSFGTSSLTSKQVKKAYVAIKDISKNDFKKLYNFQELMDEQLYPLIEDDNPDEIFEYIYSYFLEIKELYKQAVSNKQRVIFSLSKHDITQLIFKSTQLLNLKKNGSYPL
ncbi:DUF1877 family protein [Bacillus sp. DX1.1]|uniref:DUF1877 family protein n=1 Tax=unclassified Bacillus (in: firmicutes) TaxID=185979 RepID=UPI00256FAAE3|nr:MULTISPECIES: DUF1877 family protein [unclassified Bacillus (in: firmicutes)]MDM5154425.1 DUF1877 family protein [Bacillus sp. DX1.1]WJE83329.1 DUF1877 family protein [Bacillus sp. DX3.1]